MRSPILRRAWRSGAAGSLASTLALVLAARAEGRSAVQPTNATSHWLNGEGAATIRRVDLVHTGVGYATHHAATIVWALLFERLARRRRRSSPQRLLGTALATAGIAAAVDYGATPRRFTPGWEDVLSKRGMALAYAGMALGFALVAARRQGR